MHTSKVVMKDGRVRTGIIWTVRVQEGWFTLINDDGDHEPDAKTQIADCESVVTLGPRISVNEIGDQDMLAKWAEAKRKGYRN